jgi:3-dehydroquinate synthase/shikimate kinase/3-dehydroquinate synthase
MVPFLDKPIFITGFMATGKSKVGRLLAERLERAFVDTDEMIVEVAGKSISEIFEQDGEPVFRQMEHDCVNRASRMDSAVISLGGGAITQERNWEVIRETGLCLCLRASAETIFDRVSRREERPLLAGLDDEGRMQKIRALLQEREPFYSRADVFVTSTENQTPDETAEIAIWEVKRWAGDVG